MAGGVFDVKDYTRRNPLEIPEWVRRKYLGKEFRWLTELSVQNKGWRGWYPCVNEGEDSRQLGPDKKVWYKDSFLCYKDEEEAERERELTRARRAKRLTAVRKQDVLGQRSRELMGTGGMEVRPDVTGGGGEVEIGVRNRGLNDKPDPTPMLISRPKRSSEAKRLVEEAREEATEAWDEVKDLPDPDEIEKNLREESSS